MRVLDETMNITPVGWNYQDPRFNQRLWKNKFKSGKLDQIFASEEELNRMTADLEQIPLGLKKYLENPALPEFELVIRDTVLSADVTVVRYRKTLLPEQESTVFERDGGYTDVVPKVDAYVSFTNSAEFDFVMTIYSVDFVDADGYCISTVGGQETLRVNYGFKSKLKTADTFDEACKFINLVYLGIQKAMYEKPEVFYESKNTFRPKSTAGETKYREKRKARVVKQIRINTDKLKKCMVSNRHMQCPCWGVAGHWRKYRNGKQVWIQPYRKGKERNNPKAYSPKEYVMED